MSQSLSMVEYFQAVSNIDIYCRNVFKSDDYMSICVGDDNDKKVMISIYYRGYEMDKRNGLLPLCAIICHTPASARGAQEAFTKYGLGEETLTYTKQKKSINKMIQQRKLNIIIMHLTYLHRNYSYSGHLLGIKFDVIINWDHIVIQTELDAIQSLGMMPRDEIYLITPPKLLLFQKCLKLFMKSESLLLTPSNYLHLKVETIDKMLYIYSFKMIYSLWIRQIINNNNNIDWTDLINIIVMYVGEPPNLFKVDIYDDAVKKFKVDTYHDDLFQEISF